MSDTTAINALLVYPEFPPSYWSFRYAVELLGKRSAMPPLGLLTVAGMFPERYRLRLVDMNVEELTDEDLEWADLVLTSTMVAQRGSLQQVLARCNRLGKPVAVGGPHPTSYWAEIHGASFLLLDEVEETFPRFLADWEAGRPRRVYRPEGKPAITATPLPRFDLLELSSYSSMALQFSRGCPFDCEFCDITKLFGRVPRTKSNEQMLAELDQLYGLGWRGPLFLVDDNFIGNKREALRLLPAVAEWQRRRGHPFGFYTEASVNLARSEPLMDAMVEAGFTMVFLGIESPNPEALLRTKKVQNTARGNDRYLLDAVRAIQKKGMEVSGGFILGLDGDGPEVFDAQVEFIQEAGIPMAMVGLLTALRGTDLYSRLEAEDRLRGESTGNNVEIALNFEPELGRDELIAGYRRVLGTLYDPSLSRYFERCWTMLRHLGTVARPRRRIGRAEVGALVKSLRVQLLSRQGPAYLRFLLRTLTRRPKMFAEAVRLGIMGLHFGRFTRQTLAAHDFREAAVEGHDRVEELVIRTQEAGQQAAEAVRKQADAAVRRLRRLHTRLRPEFRQGLQPHLAWIQESIQECVREVSAQQLLHRAGPGFRQLFADSSWLSELKAQGYSLADRWGGATRSLAIAPLLERARLRRPLELYFRELGVGVMTATEQMTQLGQAGLDRLFRDLESRASVLEYLRSLGGRIDTLIVPLSEDLAGFEERLRVLVARPAAGEVGLPERFVCLPFEGAARRRAELAELGMALTGDRERVEAALERAFVLS